MCNLCYKLNLYLYIFFFHHLLPKFSSFCYFKFSYICHLKKIDIKTFIRIYNFFYYLLFSFSLFLLCVLSSYIFLYNISWFTFKSVIYALKRFCNFFFAAFYLIFSLYLVYVRRNILTPSFIVLFFPQSLCCSYVKMLFNWLEPILSGAGPLFIKNLPFFFWFLF